MGGELSAASHGHNLLGTEREEKSMQRNVPERRQPQPVDDKGEDESLQKPESTPNFLTARELQVREPAKNENREKPGQKRGGA